MMGCYIFETNIYFLRISPKTFISFNLLILKGEFYNFSNQVVLQSCFTFKKLQLPKALRYAFKILT